MRRKTIALAAGLAAATVITAGCTSGSSTTDQTAAAASSEAGQSAAGVDLILKNQPVPIFASSAFRMELIETEAIQALGTPTTSFFFPGAGLNGSPFKVCPSQGLPLPVDAQLDNPQQVIPDPYGGGYNLNQGGQVIAQMDPNGVYTGPGTGTYVLCLKPDGSVHLAYWEGFVFAESGTASWDKATGQVVDIGPSELPVCVIDHAVSGDGSKIKPGTTYYHCTKPVSTTAYVTGGRPALSLLGFVRDVHGRCGWRMKDSQGRSFIAPCMAYPK